MVLVAQRGISLLPSLSRSTCIILHTPYWVRTLSSGCNRAAVPVSITSSGCLHNTFTRSNQSTRPLWGTIWASWGRRHVCSGKRVRFPQGCATQESPMIQDTVLCSCTFGRHELDSGIKVPCIQIWNSKEYILKTLLQRSWCPAHFCLD